jgi:altronate dehydratase large subunit
MHADDNVALAAVDLKAGTTIALGGMTVTLRQDISFGHKFALRPIALDEIVLKYGQPIGRATAAIAPGEHAHVHNIDSIRGRGDLAVDGASVGPALPSSLNSTALKSIVAGEPPTSTFWGYRRRDGRVGVRNHVLILPTVHCANTVVERVGRMVPGVIALPHAYGCSQLGDDLAQSRRVLEEFARHPNVGAVLLVGLGCETMPTVEMGEKLAAEGLLVQRLTIQEEGGSRATYDRSVGIAREMLQEVARARREAIPMTELIVATECGGSDAWSGVTANPAVGVASDLVVAAGGTVILSETPEFIGAEHLLAARAAAPEVGQQVVDAVARREAEVLRMGVDMRGGNPAPGNIAGGLTTIEEKSLGTISKGGSTPIREFLRYGRRPSQRGLVVMDTAGNDMESVTGMVAGGAQVVVFTTGRGSPTGCPIAPVIKVATNTPMYERLKDDMDINAGSALDNEPLAAVGMRIFREIADVANGKETAAEVWGHHEFTIEVLGPRV